VNAAGTVMLSLAAAASLAGVGLPLAGRYLQRPLLVRAAMWALYTVLAFAVAAVAVLAAAFLTRDFGNLYVFEHSSRALSMVYTLSALWAGNAGSLLLWFLLMAGFAVVASRGGYKRDPASAPYLIAVLASVGLFFTLLMLFGPSSDPFAANAMVPTPDDGLGLNAMLQNTGMIIHPLALYLGYVAMAVPFGLVVAALASGSAMATCIGAVRRWALVGWLFLTIGNVVGAWWAYVSLGWGGYWAWDPVENASLIPWLTATALLHSAFVAHRRQRQQVWTVALAAATFLLTIFGTFLTRTGVASSVHAFTESRLIVWFVVYLVIMTCMAVALIVRRRAALRARGEAGSPTGESSNVLYSVILLVVVTFFIIWGVIFPPIAKSLTGRELVLGTGFFDTVTAPLGLLLLLLLAFCSLAAFSRGSRRRLVWGLAASGGVGSVVLIVLLAVGVRKGYPVAAFSLTGAAAVAVILRWSRGWRTRRGYGALVAHLGLALLVIGLAGSWSFKGSTEGQLAPGGQLVLGNVAVVYQDLQTETAPGGDMEVNRAMLALSVGGKDAGQLAPTIEYYPLSDQTWTRVARRTSAAGDIYVSLLEVAADGQTIGLKLEKHPLILWLWVGGGVMSAGALLALWPLRRRSKSARPQEGISVADGSTPSGP
jgi:cytochrome c-type biogenesis protein CcmF